MSEGTRMTLPDSRVRKEAITTRHHAFVWASAGTGKTHTLTLRALYLLLNAPFLSPQDGSADEFLPAIRSLYNASSRLERMQAARAVIRSLVMTTFTRKAAAEMQTRLYRYLDRVASAQTLSDLEPNYDEPQNQLKDPLFHEIVQAVLKNLWPGSVHREMPLLTQVDLEDSFKRLRAGAQALAELAAELQISTIHSLAASILRRHPLQAGIPPTARFAKEDEDDLVGVEDQVVERWWQREVLTDTELQDQLAKLLQVVSLAQIRHWLKQSYEFRWIPEEAEALPLENQMEIRQLLDAASALVQALAEGGGSKIEEKRDQLNGILDRIACDEEGAWSELCVFIQQVRNYFFLDRSTTETIRSAISALPVHHSRYFQSWTNFYIPAARICVAKEFGEAWKVWTNFLRRFATWADGAAIQELGLITFDEMICLAVGLLENHPQIRQAEQRRLRAVLVDEFQDTDPNQLRLLRALLKRDSGFEHEVLGFFVGDTKQSIYRFRGVDVPNIVDFHQQYESYTGCRLKRSDFHLKTSFRSVRQVTQFVNHFFERELNLTDETDALVPIRSDEALPPEWILIESDGNGESFTADRARNYAAAETLRIIQEYVRHSDSEVAPYKDILVLVRDAGEVDALVPVLQSAGIPAVSSGAKTFYRRPEVLDVLNLLIALLHPLDELAAAAVLRSPLVCLSDPDIHALLNEIPPERLFHSKEILPDFLPEEVYKRIENLRELTAQRLRRAFCDWLREVRAFIPTALYSEPGDREGRPIVRIDRVLETFQQEMEMTVTPPLVWLLKQRRRAAETGRWDVDPGEDITVADESVNAVRVMTIHKAKGLERRFAIVYGWTSVLLELKGPRGRKKRTEIIDLTSEEGQKLRGFALQWGPLRVCSPAWGKALQHEREGAKAEAKRLAYVAATRARDRMALLCPASKGCRFSEKIDAFIDSAKKAISGGGVEKADICDGTLRFVRRPGREAEHSEVTSPSVNWRADQYKKLWEKRYSDFKAPGLSLLRRPSDPEHREEREVFEDHHYRRGRDDQTRLLVGRLVHAYLERYLLDSAFGPEKLSALSFEIPELGPNPRAVEMAETLLSQFYCGHLADAFGKPYRERVEAAQILGREVPVYLVHEDQAWNGVIDLVLKEEDVIRAIDYKTTAVKDPVPEAYAQQQRIYSEALRRVFPHQTVAFEFWWLSASLNVLPD
ncbi:MAG: UvrD-helicase domain-containing protein [Acidobacteriota bacterium]